MNTPLLANLQSHAKINELPQSLIRSDLEQVERVFNQTLAPYRSSFGGLTNHLLHYRGKQLRPTLLILIGHASGAVTKSHHVLAAVVEMIHTATLIHDDVLDDATTRRHARTISAEWGDKVSILLGDLLFTNAFHLSSTLGDVRACKWIGEATNRVCAGELLQTLQRNNLHLSAGDYFSIIEGKTAALTECCGRLGAFFAGAEPERVEQLAAFGRNLGIAFQISDDVLDLIGREQTVGKTLGSDLAQRKLTLPLIYLFERLNAAEAVHFRLLLNGQAGDLDELKDALQETGAIDAAQLKAVEFADRARRALAVLPASSYRSSLESIAGWSIQRDS